MVGISALNQAMTSLTQAEVLIALVVAAHAGVLAVRLAASTPAHLEPSYRPAIAAAIRETG
jgi:photosystem I subunit 12